MSTQTIQKRRIARGLLAGLCAAGSCAGCSVSKKEAPLPESIRSDVAVTREQMRLRMRSLVEPMCGRIEHAADELAAGTTDPDVRLAALKWKMDAVPALREALFQPEPFAAAFDALVLFNQMIDYFDTGAGVQALGSASQQAAAACRGMEEDLSEVLAAATQSGDLSKVRAATKKWAAAHPIRHSISDRESALARAFEREVAEQFSTGQAIGEARVTIDDVSRKIEVYSAQLFRQARWEAERLKLETVRELRADQAIPLAERAVESAEQAAATVGQLAPLVERALTVAYDTPRIIAAERETAVRAVHDEVTRATEVVSEERVAALAQLSAERVIALKELDESITRQRLQVIADVDLLTVRRIDYTLRRVTWLVAAVVAAFALGAVLCLRYVRSLARPSGHRTLD
jgi:hypothetical protein